ncbi:DUF2092 domain-containing protein [Caballeronia sp. LP003]|uniref:DUF2092 domain-containing protein n=1 Tax=Caballeronia sp. LP003 TaxID=3038551 RepID=UPI00285CFF8A|nr:DUF2092 domain-containing protein [Caballeronia sp. LP003]MDR5785215.1 DUF2092 domain-containing protein [Caballeronia sp. LP003]
MHAKFLALALSAASLLITQVHAQNAASAPSTAGSPNAASAVDPAAVQALTTMGSYLQSMKRFSVSTELTGERVLQDGQKLQHTATAHLDVDRPQAIRAVMQSARTKRELFYNGETVSLYFPAQNYYSTVPFAGDLASLVEQLRIRFGIEIPLADLFIWGTPNAPTEQFQSAMYAGQDFVGADICDHYAFRQKGVDWQVWIMAGAKPLPRKLVITRLDDDARPQSTSTINWATKPAFMRTVFTFKPPASAKKVDIVPVAAGKEYS